MIYCINCGAKVADKGGDTTSAMQNELAVQPKSVMPGIHETIGNAGYLGTEFSFAFMVRCRYGGEGSFLR